MNFFSTKGKSFQFRKNKFPFFLFFASFPLLNETPSSSSSSHLNEIQYSHDSDEKSESAQLLHAKNERQFSNHFSFSPFCFPSFSASMASIPLKKENVVFVFDRILNSFMAKIISTNVSICEDSNTNGDSTLEEKFDLEKLVKKLNEKKRMEDEKKRMEDEKEDIKNKIVQNLKKKNKDVLETDRIHFLVESKGSMTVIKFVLSGLDIFEIIHFFVSNFENLDENSSPLEKENNVFKENEMVIKSWSSPVAYQYSIFAKQNDKNPNLNPNLNSDLNESSGKTTKNENESNESSNDFENQIQSKSKSKSNICLNIFVPLLGDSNPEIEISKNGNFSSAEINLVSDILVLSFSASETKKEAEPKTSRNSIFEKNKKANYEDDPFEDGFYKKSSSDGNKFENNYENERLNDESLNFAHENSVAASLSSLGARVFFNRETSKVKSQSQSQSKSKSKSKSRNMHDDCDDDDESKRFVGETENFFWDVLEGYEEQKKEIEDTLLLALKHPAVFDSVSKKTRKIFQTNRPTALLFEGPPGTGKTSSARAIAAQADIPLVYVPLEAIASKYYGESEKIFSKIFSECKKFENGAIIFLDEIDALATKRNDDMHEVSRRLLSVLLREMEGFEISKKILIIAATNRKQDLDLALISRFNATIYFGLPDDVTRQKIFSQYAKHLKQNELAKLAKIAEGMSGRDIRDVCEQTERRWAAKIIRNQVDPNFLPSLDEYAKSTKKRQRSIRPQEPLDDEFD